MSIYGAIIIIDDDKEDREITASAIKKLNFKNELKCFPNGKEALEFLRTTTEIPFIIFSDIDMPVMNGLQFRNEINKDPVLRRKSIPFVFMTGSATRGSVELAYEMTVQGFFKKSVSFEQLMQQIKMILDYWRICIHPNA
jgi:CheY-like chemotaxis protein